MTKLILSSLVFIAACTSVPRMNSAAKKVVFIKPQEGVCTFLQSDWVIHPWYYTASSQLLKIRMQKRAAEIGSNAIHLRKFERGHSAEGNFYSCPKSYLDEKKFE